MERGEHTPGPWFVGNEDTEEMRWDVYSPFPNGGAADIAHVVYDTAAAPSLREGLANARLIAAAPDMLAALERLSELYAAEEEADPRVLHPHGCNLHGGMAQVREAIAKAKPASVAARS